MVDDSDIDDDIERQEAEASDVRTRQRLFEGGILLGICLMVVAASYTLYHILSRPSEKEVMTLLAELLVLGFLVGNLSCCNDCRIMVDAKYSCLVLSGECAKQKIVADTQYEAYKSLDYTYA